MLNKFIYLEIFLKLRDFCLRHVFVGMNSTVNKHPPGMLKKVGKIIVDPSFNLELH